MAVSETPQSGSFEIGAGMQLPQEGEAHAAVTASAVAESAVAELAVEIGPAAEAAGGEEEVGAAVEATRAVFQMARFVWRRSHHTSNISFSTSVRSIITSNYHARDTRTTVVRTSARKREEEF